MDIDIDMDMDMDVDMDIYTIMDYVMRIWIRLEYQTLYGHVRPNLCKGSLVRH